MGDTVTKRLHIGGLTPTITLEHLRDRFKSFGTVLEVEETGLNALGEPRPFAYLTLETTPVQYRKCKLPSFFYHPPLSMIIAPTAVG